MKCTPSSLEESRRTTSRTSSRHRLPGVSFRASARPPMSSTASTSNEMPLWHAVSRQFTSPSQTPKTRSKFFVASRRATRFITASRTSLRPWSPQSSSPSATCPSRHFPTRRSAFSISRARARVGGVEPSSIAKLSHRWSPKRCASPVERLLVTDSQKLLELEQHLAEHVVGHDDVMTRVSDALRKGAAGFHGARPLATFLFLGPTGVGKTETARALNEVFFTGCPMTRIDMSELSESHAVAKLVGAPPGYIGHDTGGLLTEAIRHRPYQLVLLDEIEKAHMDVLQSLLPLLEDGRLTDGRAGPSIARTPSSS